MKTTNYIFAFITCIILLAFSSPGNYKSETIESQKPVIDTISVNKFNQWTSNWKTYGKKFTQISLIEYFTIPKSNFEQILATNPASVRVHMGLDITTNPFTAHLIVVGVDANGQDMVDYSRGLFYYDFTKACPNYCLQN